MPATWIILVNWNGGADTLECLESLLRLDDGDFAVAVVDNGSTDGSIKRLTDWANDPAPARPAGPPWARLPAERRHAPEVAVVDAATDATLPPPSARITMLAAGRNLGFAAANNLGMRFAAADPDARYVWILNNDTVVAPYSLGIQRARMDADPRLAMLGARLMFYDEPDVVQGLAGGYHPWRARGYHIGLGLAGESLPAAAPVEAEMAYVLGASIFARRAAIDRIGGMSERYFLYFEELDWARRLAPGDRMGVALDAVVFHKEGRSIGSATRTRPSATSLYYLSANLLRFTAAFDRARLPVAVLRVLRVAAGHAAKRDSEATRATLRALADVPRGIARRGRYGSPEFEARG